MPDASGLPPRKRGAGIVHYADDIVILGKESAATVREAVEDVMKRLKLPLNADGPCAGPCTLRPRSLTQPQVGNQTTEAYSLPSGNGRFWRIDGDRHTVE